MTENNKPQSNKLGELFVEFGAKGAPSLLKTLNSISASFLLTKNAATQALKPITELSKQSAAKITGFDKFNAITGLTIKQLQQLDMWTKLNNVDFHAFMGQIHGLQQNLLDIQTGKGGNINGFALLGLDPRSMSYKKPLEALEQIRKRVQQVDEATGVYALRQLGLSEQLLYAWRQENNQIDKRLLLNDKEIASLKEQQKSWNILGVTISNTFQKAIAGATNLKGVLKDLTTFVRWVGNTFSFLLLTVNGLWGLKEKVIGAAGENFGESLAQEHYESLERNGKSVVKNKRENMTPEQQKRYDEAMARSDLLKEETPEQIEARKRQNIANAAMDGLQEVLNDYKELFKVAAPPQNYSNMVDNISPMGGMSPGLPTPPPPVTNESYTTNIINVDNKQYITTPDTTEAARLSNHGIGSTVQEAVFNRQNQFGI